MVRRARQDDTPARRFWPTLTPLCGTPEPTAFASRARRRTVVMVAMQDRRANSPPLAEKTASAFGRSTPMDVQTLILTCTTSCNTTYRPPPRPCPSPKNTPCLPIVKADEQLKNGGNWPVTAANPAKARPSRHTPQPQVEPGCAGGNALPGKTCGLRGFGRDTRRVSPACKRIGRTLETKAFFNHVTRISPHFCPDRRVPVSQ